MYFSLAETKKLILHTMRRWGIISFRKGKDAAPEMKKKMRETEIAEEFLLEEKGES